ncbi:hypothetical protein N2152v2_002344 [Parachlorella kessleri]
MKALKAKDSTQNILEKEASEGNADISGPSDSSEGCQQSEPAVSPPYRLSLRQFLLFLGPGLLMSVAYLDPGNLQADIQAGSQTGFALLWWFALVMLVCGTAFQCMSGRLGIITGRDLAQHCGQQYGRFARLLLWVLIEIAIIGADVQETVGCAQALHLLSQSKIPLWAGCIITSVTAFMLLMLERTGSARWLEALFGAVIGVEAVAMAVNFFQAGVPASKIARGLFVPSIPSGSIPVLVGALGALVMPYNIYFHSSVVNRRKHDASCEKRARGLLWYLRLENVLILFMAFLINLCVTCVFAYGFHDNPDYPTDDIGLESAGIMLGERFGTSFKYLWAIGLLASGQIATVGLTYAGQLVMCGLLNLEVKGWVRFWGTRLVALAPTVAIASLSNANNSFDKLNSLLNIVQSLQLPFALIPVIHMTANRNVIGATFRTRLPLLLFASGIAAVVVGINGWVLVDFLKTKLPQTAGAYAGWSLLMATYFCIVLYYAIGPERVGRWAERSRRQACGLSKRAAQLAGRIQWRDPESMLEVHL